MAILEHDVRSGSGSAVSGLTRRLFSSAEYQALGRTGIFDTQRVELIEGEILEMSPIGPVHAAITEPLADSLKRVFGDGYVVRSRAPIVITDGIQQSEPQPDIVVAVGTWRDYLAAHPNPNQVQLVVEVADTSLESDRTTKFTLYAAAGIPEYWIVNLVQNQVEVYRGPSSEKYSTVTIHTQTETVTPLHAGAPVTIADFLP